MDRPPSRPSLLNRSPSTKFYLQSFAENRLFKFTENFQQSNFYYTRGITPKRVTSGGPNSGLASGQHSSEETSQWWRADDDTVSDSTCQGTEPQASHTDNDVFNDYANLLDTIIY